MRALRAGILVVLAAVAAGCGDEGPPGTESDEARRASVYAAILEDVAEGIPVEDDGDPSDRVVFVEPFDEDLAIGLEVQAGVVRQLEGVVEVSFVDDREAAVEGDEDDAPVRDGAALVALGPVPDGSRRVVVEVRRRAGEDGEERLRYVVERTAGDWDVAEHRSLG